MLQGVSIIGARELVRNLQRKDRAFARGIMMGLRKGGVLIQRQSQLQVPVEFGNLKASAFTRAFGLGFQTKVTVGYTASYALFVHEAVAMKLKGQLRGGLGSGQYEDAQGKVRVKDSGKFATAAQRGGRKGRYWDPQGRAKAKFLEDPVRENKDKVTQIVRDEAFKAKWK